MLWSKSSPPLLNLLHKFLPAVDSQLFVWAFDFASVVHSLAPTVLGWSTCLWHTPTNLVGAAVALQCRKMNLWMSSSVAPRKERAKSWYWWELRDIVSLPRCLLKSIVVIVGHTQMVRSNEAPPCLVYPLTPANPNHHWLLWRSWASHHLSSWCLTCILLELQWDGAWIWHIRPSTQWCENRGVARHASRRNVYPLVRPTWGRPPYHNDTCHRFPLWSCGEFHYRLDFESLTETIRFTRVCEDASFRHSVSAGMNCKTRPDKDDGF